VSRHDGLAASRDRWALQWQLVADERPVGPASRISATPPSARKLFASKKAEILARI
jgi:hypothetical protein